MTKAEYLAVLEGQEIISLEWEGTILVKKEQFWQNGEVVCANPTKKQLSVVSQELFRQEFGYEVL